MGIERAILVVDDRPQNRESLSGVLSDFDIAAHEAGSAKEAVEMARARRYDLVFMDYNMPGGDGLEAARAIRRFSDVPVVLWTDNRSLPALTLQELVKAGVHDYLGKPTKYAEVEQVLRKYSLL